MITVCMSCEKPFTPNLDACLCDDCVTEAYQHKPQLYAQITLVGFGGYVQPIDQLAQSMDAELDGADEGTKWEIELIKMTPAEYDALPEYAGH